MITIGVTGGSGAGKSVVLDCWRGLGAEIINADEVYHDLLSRCEPMRSELRARFPEVFSPEGVVNRSALGKIAFCDEQALLELNNITHKYVIGSVLQSLDEMREDGVAVLEALYLIESGADSLCDETVAIIAPLSLRLERIMRRDGLTREDAERRVQRQKPDAFYRENCGIILENNGTEQEWLCKAKSAYERIITKVRSTQNV